MALSLLADAYARLSLDPAADGAERLMVWAAWQGPYERLTASEQQALAEVRSELKRHRDDGGDCMEHIALVPARQLQLLRQWRACALHWSSLPVLLQRRLMREGKEIVNACCLRRRRDDWKWHSRGYLQELALCVDLAERELSALWRSDINHRILLELVLAAPGRLAPLLQRSLPCLSDVLFEHRGVYERAVVCLLRTRHREALLALELKLMSRRFCEYSEYELRILSHLVRMASPNAADVLRAVLELPALHQTARKGSGARFLKDCLLNVHGGALGELQARLAARLLALLPSVRTTQLTRQLHGLARGAREAEASEEAPPLEEALAPRPCLWEHVPDAECSEPIDREAFAAAPFSWEGAEARSGGAVLCAAPLLLWCQRSDKAARHFCFYTPLRSAQS